MNAGTSRPIGGWAITLGLMVFSALTAWFFAQERGKTTSPPKTSPASSVGKVVKEADLTTVTISAEAKTKLNIRAVPVERRTLKRVRLYGGDVMVPAGQTMNVLAPLNGQIKAPPKGMPQPGEHVTQGQPILTLIPILSPEGRANLQASLVNAEGLFKTAKTQVDNALIPLERAQKLYSQQAGNKKAVDDAQAVYDVALDNFKMAEASKNLFEKVIGDDKSGSIIHPIEVSSPLDGIVMNIHATTGDTVPGNAPLFVVTRLDPVWVRVAPYVGDLSEIDLSAPASIAALGGPPGKALALAKPVVAPPSATALASSLDLFFAMPNKAGMFRPGQRLGVTLSLKSDQDNLVAPWSALVHDIHGGSWVYEQLEPTKFIRRRVLLKHVQDDVAVLAEGPAVGTLVVADGAEELFGIEVGFAK